MAMVVRQGSKFLHRQHGVGRVQSVRERGFSGHPNATYVELYFAREELTVTLLRENLPDEVRDVISADEAADVLTLMEDWDKAVESNWKSRANRHQAAIESGDPYEYAKVLKELSSLSRDKPLRASDKAHFNQSHESADRRAGLLPEPVAGSHAQSWSPRHWGRLHRRQN